MNPGPMIMNPWTWSEHEISTINPDQGPTAVCSKQCAVWSMDMDKTLCYLFSMLHNKEHAPAHSQSKNHKLKPKTKNSKTKHKAKNKKQKAKSKNSFEAQSTSACCLLLRYTHSPCSRGWGTLPLLRDSGCPLGSPMLL